MLLFRSVNPAANVTVSKKFYCLGLPVSDPWQLDSRDVTAVQPGIFFKHYIKKFNIFLWKLFQIATPSNRIKFKLHESYTEFILKCRRNNEGFL